ncbi:MAG: uridine diphosphate-N-acetylglucosamine-binding protein YvcK [Erysipelotrichaceae bacterium]
MKKVVVIGGGTGQSIMLRAVKNICDIDLTTIVTVADDGGSTGRLREIFDFPAVGDIRSLMIALSEDENLLADLMAYRFDDSTQELSGHNLGNLILAALINNSHSFLEAVNQMSHFLKVKGEIVPSTGFKVILCAKMLDGEIVEGEHNITDYQGSIERVFYKDRVYANPLALKSIEDADYIIFSIGSLYTSILPNVIIEDIKLAIGKTQAKKIYFCNALSELGETTNYPREDHVRVLEQH